MKFELASSKSYDLSAQMIHAVIPELYEKVHIGTGIEDEIKVYYHTDATIGRTPLAFVQTDDNEKSMSTLLTPVKNKLRCFIETKYWILSMEGTLDNKYQVKLFNKEEGTPKISIKEFLDASEEFFNTLYDLMNMDYTRAQTIIRVNSELQNLQSTLKPGDAANKLEMILEALEDVEHDLY